MKAIKDKGLILFLEFTQIIIIDFEFQILITLFKAGLSSIIVILLSL